MSGRSPNSPSSGSNSPKREYLVERKAFGTMQRVTVIDPETGQEAMATGPLQHGVMDSLTNIAIAKLRRGIRT